MGTDTKLLEECGWNGILIEPSEGLFEFCKQTRKCIVENYALVSEDYTSDYISEIPVFQINHILPNFPINSGNYNAISFNKLLEKHNIDKIIADPMILTRKFGHPELIFNESIYNKQEFNDINQLGKWSF